MKCNYCGSINQECLWIEPKGSLGADSPCIVQRYNENLNNEMRKSGIRYMISMIIAFIVFCFALWNLI